MTTKRSLKKKYLTCDPPVESVADEIAFAPPDEINEAISRVVEWTRHPVNDSDLTPAEFILRKLEEDARKILIDAGISPDLSDLWWITKDPDAALLEHGEALSVRLSSAADFLLAADTVRDRIDNGDASGAALGMARAMASAMRMKMYEPALHGIDHSRTQSEAGKKRGKQISTEKQREHDSWKEEAAKVWKKRPGASKSAVAGIVQSRLKSPASIRTIRAVI